MKSPVNKSELKENIKLIKKQLKVVWNNKDNNPNWRNDYGNLKDEQKKLEEQLNGKEVRIWIECQLFNHLIWTEKKGWGIPDLPFKWDNPATAGKIDSEFDWVKFEKVDKCEKCAKLTDQEIRARKIENKMWDEVGDELTYREIKNHGWAK